MIILLTAIFIIVLVWLIIALKCLGDERVEVKRLQIKLTRAENEAASLRTTDSNKKALLQTVKMSLKSLLKEMEKE